MLAYHLGCHEISIGDGVVSVWVSIGAQPNDAVLPFPRHTIPHDTDDFSGFGMALATVFVNPVKINAIPEPEFGFRRGAARQQLRSPFEATR